MRNWESKEYLCYETVDLTFETAVFEMGAEASINLLFDFGDNPMNVMDLPLEEKDYINKEISKSIKSNIEFTYKTDKSLISGIKIQVGSLLIDTSVSNKLKRIKQSMIES